MSQKLQKKEETFACDFVLLDQLFSFIEGEEHLPILAGYFFKIVNFLLQRQRKDILKYLIFERKRKPVFAMLKLVGMDSVTKLLIELLSIDADSMKTQKSPNQGVDEEEEESKEEVKDEEDVMEEELMLELPRLQALVMG